MKRLTLRALLVSILAVLPAMAVATPAYACGSSSASQQVIKGIYQTSSSEPANCGQSAIGNAISEVVKILSLIVGAASVIAIVWSGYKYITSGGDSGKVSNAKGTIIYAIVGLAVAVIAQVIVNIVITQSANIANCPSGQHYDQSTGKCAKN